jgi:hypothetical protein
METVLVISSVALHSVVSSIFLFDLYTVSQRTNKFKWAILLLCLPFASVYLYSKTRKRNRPHNGKITKHKVLAREQRHEYEQMSA